MSVVLLRTKPPEANEIVMAPSEALPLGVCIPIWFALMAGSWAVIYSVASLAL